MDRPRWHLDTLLHGSIFCFPTGCVRSRLGQATTSVVKSNLVQGSRGPHCFSQSFTSTAPLFPLGFGKGSLGSDWESSRWVFCLARQPEKGTFRTQLEAPEQPSRWSVEAQTRRRRRGGAGAPRIFWVGPPIGLAVGWS